MRLTGRRRWAGFAMFAIVGLVAMGCGGSDDSAESSESGEAGPQSLRVISYDGSLFSLPFDVAEAEDMFTKNDLEVSVVNGQDGPTSTSALAAGSIDVILSSIDNSLVGRDKDLDLVAIAGLGGTTQSLIVNSDVPTPNLDEGFPGALEDLEGTALGVSARGAGTDVLLRFMLTEAGLDPDNDVTILPVGFADTALAALNEGRIDGYMATEPVTTTTTNDGTTKIVLDLRTGDVPPLEWDFAQWVAMEDNVEEKPEAMDRFRAAMRDSLDFIADPANRERVTDIIAEEVTGGDRELAEQLVDANLETFGPFEVSPESVTEASEVFLEAGVIDNGTTPEEYLRLE